MFDPSTPIYNFTSEKARDEVLLVSFNGAIRSMPEAIIRHMLQNMSTFIKVYPRLKSIYDTYSDMKKTDEDIEIYDFAKYYVNEFSTLDKLSDGKLSPEELASVYHVLLPKINLSSTTMTILEFSLYRLLSEDNVKKCYIYNEVPLQPNQIEFMDDIWKSVKDKIEYVPTVKNIVDTVKEVGATTVITNGSIATMEMLCALPEEVIDSLKDVLFLFVETSEMFTENEEGDMVTSEHVNEMINDLISKGINTAVVFNDKVPEGAFDDIDKEDIGASDDYDELDEFDENEHSDSEDDEFDPMDSVDDWASWS